MAGHGAGAPWQPGLGPHAHQQAGPISTALGGLGALQDDGDARLRSLDDLPQAFRPVFAGAFRYFNAIQSESFREVAQSPMNVVLAAPTGSGKTVVMELAILQLLSQHIDQAGAYHHRPGCLKVMYLAPARALVQEKTREWTERFGKTLGLVVREMTGDTDIHDLDNLDATDIICTTPEKFDAMTRRHRANGGMRFFNEIALVLIDEVHLLNESRGSSLEAGVISRIKMVSQLREMRENPIGRVRFVAVSATIPNIQDIADWLSVPPQGVKVFGEEMRPVKLRTVVRGYSPTRTDFLFERRLNDHISSVVADFSKGKPTLVFCSSRKGTSETAQHLAKEAVQRAAGGRPSIYIRDVAHNQRLLQATADLKNGQLKECIKAGVAFHHAAMEPAERALVEQLFTSMDILVLCTTSTLAMGVNLPAHLVVIKGTRRYIGSEAEDPSGYQEYERSTCLQMVGRAGRPQFDTEGYAVIMTQKQHVPRYEQLVTGSETVESALKDMLPEFLNAEIALRTVSDVSMAIEWLKSTFFYIRVKRNPAHYDVPRQLLQSAEALDRWVKEKLVLSTIHELSKHGMVRTDEDGFMLEPLQPGIIQAEHYIRMRTMISITGASTGATIPDLINIVARSAELSNIKLRRGEKKQLNEINHGGGCRYQIMNPAKPGKVLERISSADQKVFILVNTAVSDQPVDRLEYSLRQEMDQVVSVGSRITGAMIKYFQHVERASETFNSFLLHKNFKNRLWTDSMYETRQLPGIGPLISERLAAAGIHKLQQLAEIDPRRLESITQRHYPFGNEVHDALRSRMPPLVELQVAPVGRSGATVDVEVTAVRVEGTGNPALKSRACLLVGTLGSNKLLACRPLCLESFPSPLRLRLKANIPKGSVAPLKVVASVVHERLVGVDVATRLEIPLNLPQQGKPAWPGPQQQQQEQQADMGHTPAASDQPVEASMESGEGSMEVEGLEGLTADGQPGPSMGGLPPPAAALAGQSSLLAAGADAAQPKPESEARQFMSLQQALALQRAKVLGPAAARAQPARGLDQPLIAEPVNPSGSGGGLAQPGLAAPLGMPGGRSNTTAAPALPVMAAGASLLPQPAMAAQLPSHAGAGVGASVPAVPRQPGASKWAGFLKPTSSAQLASAAAPTQGMPAAGAADPQWATQGRSTLSSRPLLPPPAQVAQPPMTLAAAQQERPGQAMQGTAAAEGAPPQLALDGLATSGAGLFSQFRCSKPGSAQRPAQAVLLAKLAGKQPVGTTVQRASAWNPAPAGPPFRLASGLGMTGGLQQAQQQQEAPTAMAPALVLPPSTQGASEGAAQPAWPPAGSAAAILSQKRKLDAPQPPALPTFEGVQQKENQGPAPPPLAGQPPAGSSIAGLPPVKRPALILPKLNFMSSRWSAAPTPAAGSAKPLAAELAGTAGKAAAGDAVPEAPAPRAPAVPEMDLSQCFSFL